MTFKFKFKKSGQVFWRSREVIGYRYDDSRERMLLYFEGGGMEELSRWHMYDAKLGADWFLAMKNKMEKDSGTSIPVNAG